MGRQRRTYQRRVYDGKAAKGAVNDHRRVRVESRAHQQRGCDGKAAKGAADCHRRGRAESRAYQRRAYDEKAAKNVSAESVRWEGSEGSSRRPSTRMGLYC